MLDNPVPGSTSNRENHLVPVHASTDGLRHRLATLLGHLLAQAWLRSRQLAPGSTSKEGSPENDLEKANLLSTGEP
jgi:hypothetical protein